MNNVEAMTPVQPGAYVALYKNRKTGEFHREDVVAIVASRVAGGWIEFEALSVRGGYDLRVPESGAPPMLDAPFEYHGFFKPDEVEPYISEQTAKKAATQTTHGAG